MRRTSAISLLAAIGFMLIAPGALLDPESNLPACCRRAGAHHCMMNNDEPAPGSGTSFSALRQACPFFPTAIAVPSFSKGALAKPSAAIFAALVSHPSIQFQTEARYYVSFSRSRHERGPPSFLS